MAKSMPTCREINASEKSVAKLMCHETIITSLKLNIVSNNIILRTVPTRLPFSSGRLSNSGTFSW